MKRLGFAAWCLGILLITLWPRTDSAHKVAVQQGSDKQAQSVMASTIREYSNNHQVHQSLGLLMSAQTGNIKALITNSPDGNWDGANKPYEPGSIMKPLLIAAAINEGKITADNSYYDPGYTYVDGRLIVNAVAHKPMQMTTQDVLDRSLNTGAVHTLRKLSDSSHIDTKARTTWYKYLTQNYLFNDLGYVRKPTGGRGLDLQYARSSYGVGMTVSPMQLVAAYGAMLNGGNYYEPGIGSGTMRESKVVSERTSKQMKVLLKHALEENEPAALIGGDEVGAKSGSAPIADHDGLYKIGKENGTYIGYLRIKGELHIMMVRLDAPVVDKYQFASKPAKEAWAKIANKLRDPGTNQ